MKIANFSVDVYEKIYLIEINRFGSGEKLGYRAEFSSTQALLH